MRHILIKIFLIISIAGFGQTQQYLHNGFVAATDSGLWYLQDGFSEWVMLNTSSIPFIGDSISGVSQNGGNKFLWCNANTLDYGGGEGASPYKIYGARITKTTSYYNFNTPVLYKTKNITSKCVKYGDCYVRFVGATKSRIDVYIDFDVNELYFLDSDDYSDLQYWSSITSDTDSTYCWVGTNNTLYKGYVTDNATYQIMSSVSGLHSRTTDSHKITYNEDDDEFIIVSDSGIVYSYDKTTLTTLDTIDVVSESSIDKVLGLVYNKAQIMVLTLRVDGVEIVSSHDLSSLSSSVYLLGYSAGYDLEVSKNNNDFIYITYKAVPVTAKNVYYLDENGNETNKTTTGLPSNITFFDLDYINN